MAPGSFVPKVASVNTLPFSYELHSVFAFDLLAIDRFIAAVPYTENDSSLGGTVYLHSKVPSVPTACHIKGGCGIFDGGDFTVKSCDICIC